MKLGGKLLLFGITAILSLSPRVGWAMEIVAEVHYAAPHITEAGSYHRVRMPDAMNLGEAGTPSLPSAGLWFLLPPGERAGQVELLEPEWLTVDGVYKVEPNTPPYKISEAPVETAVEPSAEIYGGEGFYPASVVTALRTHLKRGVSVATCRITPVRWDPATGELQYLSGAVVRITTEQGEREKTGFEQFYRGDTMTLEWALDKVVNPGMFGRYPHRDDPGDESILVIAGEELLAPAEEYATWRRTRGIPAYATSCEALVEGTGGRDIQECIREGIADRYEELNVGYVLLVGDTEFIPHRGLWGTVNGEPDADIPADIYYAGLDGDWNDDNDGNWGEWDEGDFASEVFIGRIPGSDVDEVGRSLRKIYRYEGEPVVDDVLNVLMVGEELGWQPMGGDYMDEVYDGSNNWGYRTVGFPERFDDTRTNLYERDGGAWNAVRELAPLISRGNHFIHHLGHASTRYALKFNYNDIDDEVLSNDGHNHLNNIAYSQGCYCGAFDNRGTEVGQYVGDCIGEKFISHLNNGFVAFFCNSRYGWGNGANTDGASQAFEREFVDAMFAENKLTLGAANHDSKEDRIPWLDNLVMMWCLYEINLLGDPAMTMWVDTPRQLEVECDGIIFLGERSFEVTVAGVEDVLLCLSRTGEILSTARTDAEGYAEMVLDEPVVEQGSVMLSAIAPGYLQFYTEIGALAPEGGFPWVESFEISDDEGNGDGQADSGEEIALGPVVRNIGSNLLRDLTIRLETDDPLIEILQDQVEYSIIAPAGESTPRVFAAVRVGAGCPDLYSPALQLTIEDGAGHTWNQELNLVVHAPVLSSQRFTVIDDDGDGRLSAGEEAELDYELVNSGSGRVGEVRAVLVCDNPQVEIIEAETSIDLVEPLTGTPSGSPFRIGIADDCPNPYRFVFYVRLYVGGDYHRSLLSELEIGGALYTMEDGEADDWDHRGIDNGEDQWHVNVSDNRTPDGSRCLKVGGEGLEEQYARGLNCVIDLPPLTPTGAVELVFYHKMDAEIDSDNPGEAFDGGFVEARSGEGGAWETIYPKVGRGQAEYPCSIIHGESVNPLPEGQSCYSGSFDWQPAVFDLSQYGNDELFVRFHFGSDGSVQRGGWWIDDIELRFAADLIAPGNLHGEMLAQGASLYWDSPPVRDDDSCIQRLLGYHVWRSFDILDTLVTDNRYLDRLVGEMRGDVGYLVTAIYTTGESQPSNMIELHWPANVDGDDAQPPEEWTIEAVYPNPFNHVATIDYTVPRKQYVRLALYDMKGAELVRLAEGYRSAGRYTSTVDASGFASGIYFVRLVSQKSAISRKLALIK